MQRRHAVQDRRALLIFFIVANVWTWSLWLPPLLIARQQGVVLPSPDNYARLAAEGFSGGQHMVLAIVFSLAVYGPLIGAILATSFEQGLSGVQELLAQTIRVRITLQWYVIAFSIAAAIAFIPPLVGWFIGSLTQQLLDFASVALLFVPLFVLQCLTSGLGEEPGWRGYLLPRLQQRLGVHRSVWVLGLIWAVWHYPLTSIYILQGIPETIPMIGAVIAVVVGLFGQTMGLIGLNYIYVWLFKHTQSIFLMIVFHALTNTLPFLVPPIEGAWVVLVGVFPWIVVLVLQRLVGKEHFP